MSRLFVGTSGWNYPHWKGVFYPEGLSKGNWLQHYAGFFNCVELNVTFYRLVQKKTFQNWHDKTPEGFSFAAKGSRFITHIKRLKEARGPLSSFADNLTGLKGKLEAVLWQLPPGFKKDLQRLEIFLKLLKKYKARQVFEFRNETWFDRDTYALLRDHNACLCIAHSSRFPCAKEITAGFIYLRFHGAGPLYGSDYPARQLREWVDFANSAKRDVFAFFNNDACGYAVKNALEFRELLER